MGKNPGKKVEPKSELMRIAQYMRRWDPEKHPRGNMDDIADRLERVEKIISVQLELVNSVLKSTDIPKDKAKLAAVPIDSPFWNVGKGFGLSVENLWIEGNGWLVTNSTVGPYRMRHICKIIKTVRVVDHIKL